MFSPNRIGERFPEGRQRTLSELSGILIILSFTQMLLGRQDIIQQKFQTGLGWMFVGVEHFV